MKKWYHKEKTKKERIPRKSQSLVVKGRFQSLEINKRWMKRTPSFPHSFPFPPPLDVIIFHIPLVVRSLFYFSLF
jgi:hypothetical protein